MPLHEIKHIRDNALHNEINADDASEFNDETESHDDGNEKSNTFAIETIEEGYNSGRTYQIQASAADIRTILDDLIKLSNAAREEAAAKSKFHKSQQRVGKFFNSNIIQRALAILIFAVRSRQLKQGVHITHVTIRLTMQLIFRRISLRTWSNPKSVTRWTDQTGVPPSTF